MDQLYRFDLGVPKRIRLTDGEQLRSTMIEVFSCGTARLVTTREDGLRGGKMAAHAQVS